MNMLEGNDDLQAALGDLDAQLAEKATKGQIVSQDLKIASDSDRLKLINMSDEVIQAIAGTAPVNMTPTANSVTSEKLADESVIPEKISFVTKGKNLYNHYASIAGKRFDTTAGTIIDSPTHALSDFIKIKPNTTYAKNYTVRCIFYDINKQYLRTLGFSTTNPIVTGANDAYIRFDVSLSNSSLFMLNEGVDLLPFEPFEYFIESTPKYPLTLKNVKGTGGESGHIYVEGTSSQAIQNAFDRANGEVVVLKSGAEYNVTSTITVNPKKVRGIVGNNATLVVDTDITVLAIVGTLPSTASANPSSYGDDMYDEMNMFIDKVRVTCDKPLEQEANFVGTALSIDSTLGLNITDCHFFKLKNGIQFKNRNRNTNISGSHILYLTGVAVLFDNTSNHHQINMTGNHISYFRKGLQFMPGSQTFNFQFVGNDLECSTTPQVVEHIILCENVVMLEGFQATGNTIEDHGHCINPLMVFNSTYRTIKQLHFVGNDLGNAVNGVFRFNSADQIVITDNSSDGDLGYFVEFDLTDHLTSVQIKDNMMRDVELIKLTTSTAGKYVENIDVSGNIVKNARILPVISLSGSDIRESSFDNNQVQVHSSHGDVTKPVMLVTGGTFRNSTIKGNKLRGTAKAKHALQFDATMSEAVFITENIGYQTVDAKFVLPSATTNKIIRDNV